MSQWRVAKSLEVLLGQINALAPGRDKSSDGGIGDAAHASRNSDHNPWVIDSNGVGGIVTARDFTHDPAGGCDCNHLVQSLVDGRDRRIKYIIWNRLIINSPEWVWKTYSGANPHTHHAHVSVHSNYHSYDDESFWKISLPPPDQSAAVRRPYPLLKKGDKGDAVKKIQTVLGVTSDGVFGGNTSKAVTEFQARHGLTPDGIVGPYTWDKLLAI